MSLSYIKRAEQGHRSALYIFFAHCATIMLSIGAMAAGQSFPLFTAIAIKLSSEGKNSTEILREFGELKTMDKMMSYFPYHIGFLLIMLGFIFLILALWVSVKFIQRRKFGTLWSEEDRFRGRNFWIAVIISLVLFGGSDFIIHLVNPTYHTWVFDANKFWIYLPFALALIPLQTLAEELFFRAYLYQTFGLLSEYLNKLLGWSLNSKWIALLLSATIFGVFHFGNAEMSIGFWKMAMIYIGSGLMIGLSVLISKGIEFGWGFHLVNNLYLSTISTFPGSSLSGPTLFSIPKPTGDRILIEFAVQFALFTLILCIVYRKNVKTLFSRNA